MGAADGASMVAHLMLITTACSRWRFVDSSLCDVYTIIVSLHPPTCLARLIYHIHGTSRNPHDPSVSTRIHFRTVKSQSILTKFAAKWHKRFPPHLNSVSTLPCETWNAYCARAIRTIVTNCYQKKLQNLSHCNCGLQIHQILSRL